jgi:succinate dehydrogenase/fumarate reductase flavoprotein subunit
MTPSHQQQTRQIDCDLLVIGSGASGLAAAVTAAWHGLKVVVVEKDTHFGGASAWSGGWAWVPGNPLARRAGIMRIRSSAHLPEERIGRALQRRTVDAFLDNAPHMVAFFERFTALKWADGNGIPDVHGVPGAATQGHQVIAASAGRWGG